MKPESDALSQSAGHANRRGPSKHAYRRRGFDGRMRQDYARIAHGRVQHEHSGDLLPAGPMLRGNWKGKVIGSGTDLRKFWTERCAGALSLDDWHSVEDGIARSPGFCMTMGTASTMTALTEALGFTLPGASSIPAVDSAHPRMAADCGSRIVEMVWENLQPSLIATREAFENAITVDMAIGGSTNAIIHLVAMAARLGITLSLDDFDRISRRTPVIANIRPSGQCLMEDFYYAADCRSAMQQIAPLLHLECLTVNGNSLGET